MVPLTAKSEECPAPSDTTRPVHVRGGILLAMAAGSILGAFIGGQLLGIVSSAILLPALATILLVSAVKVWLHK